MIDPPLRTEDERRTLILAPVGRTARLARRALEKGGFACTICGSARELCEEMERGTGAALLLEEALAAEADARRFAAAIDAQPEWSDLPVTIFVADLARSAPSLKHISRLSSGRCIVVLERPIQARALLYLTASALRNRDRQYRLRDLLAEYGEARARAEEANRAKGEFLAVMSHELRTPLNAIIGYADLLQTQIAGPLLPAQFVQLERIRKSAGHLLGLIEDILSYSRMEVGKEEILAERIDAVSLARETLRFIEPSAAGKGLTLLEEVPSDPVEIETDPRKLRQILLNLMSNAVKFTERGSIELTLAREAGEWISFTVTDTGGGIAPEHQGRIFEPFEQVDASLTRRREGTGLGLGVSRKLAILLGGDLSVTSRLGEGSAFILRLPRYAAQNPSGPAGTLLGPM